MFRKILLAYDGSEGANRALAVGIDLAKIHGAELWAVAVEEKLPRFSGTIDEVQEEKQFANEQYGKLLEAAKVKAKEAGIELKTLMRPGHPAQTIMSAGQRRQVRPGAGGPHRPFRGLGGLLGHHRGKGEPPRPVQRPDCALRLGSGAGRPNLTGLEAQELTE